MNVTPINIESYKNESLTCVKTIRLQPTFAIKLMEKIGLLGFATFQDFCRTLINDFLDGKLSYQKERVVPVTENTPEYGRIQTNAVEYDTNTVEYGRNRTPNTVEYGRNHTPNTVEYGQNQIASELLNELTILRKIKTAYDEVFEKANSENILIMSVDEFEEKIYEMVETSFQFPTPQEAIDYLINTNQLHGKQE